MPKTLEEILKLLPPGVKIVEPSYAGYRNTATFIDANGNVFKRTVRSVVERSGKQRTASWSEAKLSEKLEGTRVKLKEGTYRGPNEKCTLIDEEFGEWAITARRITKHTRHPACGNALRAEKQKKFRNSLTAEQKNTITTKMMQTSADTQAFQRAQRAREATNLEKYGTTQVMDVPTIREKQKSRSTDPNLRKQIVAKTRSHGLWPTQRLEIRKILSEKMKDRPEFWKERKKLMLAKYGVEHYAQTEVSKRRRREAAVSRSADRSKFWPEEAEKHGKSASRFNYLKKRYGEAVAIRWIYSEKRYSSLEKLFSEQFGVSHFQKHIPNVKKRPDFQISESVYVDVDGLYWHSELHLSREHHMNKRKQYESANLRLLQFREDEIVNKFPVVKGIIDTVSGNNHKIYARHTEIKTVNQSEASVFLEANHLMGAMNAKHIGLFHEGELICLLSYKGKDGRGDISRFCSKVGVTVVGGFSKLFAQIEHLHTEWSYWVDLRYGTGEFLRKIGWEQRSEVLSWKWTDGINTFNRLRCRANMDERRLSEKEHAAELRWYKIYDAGQRLFVKKNNSNYNSSL